MEEFMYGAKIFILYLIPMAVFFLSLRKFIRINDELFRKILHFILLGAYIPLVFAFDKWWMASLFSAIAIVVLYPLLAALEKLPAFAWFTNQRRSGEIKNSMVLAFSMMTISTCICWGIFKDRYLVLACVYAWGVGDAFAALVGKRFGKHKIKFKYADKKKSVEGSLAMWISSAIAVFIVLMIRGNLSPLNGFVIAILSSFASMMVELCTKNGYDTFTCPLAAMLVILPMLSMFGG